MWRSPYEIGNDKHCGQHQYDAGAACCQTTMDESCNEATVCDECEHERDNEKSAVVLTRQCDGLKNERDNHQWRSDSEQPTDALRSFHDVLSGLTRQS